MKVSKKFIAVLAIVTCLILALALVNDMKVEINVEGEGVGNLISMFGGSDNSSQKAPLNVAETTAPVVQTPVIQAPADNAEAQQTTAAPSVSNTSLPSTNEEIIKKYTELVDKFKIEKPAYKKKEFQALPEEYRNFGTAVNVILNLASGYMTTEEDCEELVRAKGSSEEILYDMPIHGVEKGCVLTDYNAVSWAKCEDIGNGNCKISFSLKEEVNAEPTPAETLVPVSAHGAVMQPVKRSDITTEVDKITSSVRGLSLNQFDLTYRDCVFECVYNSQTNQVSSITHHVVIDIAADIKLFTSNINGTARLLNEMLIYDITW
ncbi:MAG: hypothetical protein IJ262_06690 [Clostridia bacterium]|nr:hypothetical protein [Clostridia bacterium]